MTFAIENPQTQTDFIDSIANKMIGIDGGHWTDADPALTTSSTPRGRVIKYTNGDESLYVAFILARYGYSDSTSEGVLVFVSDGWDMTAHCPTGNIQRLHMPVRVGSQSIGEQYISNDTPLNLYLWWEDDILLIAYRSTGVSLSDVVYLFAMEHDADKEYDDGQGRFFIFTTGVTDSSYGFYLPINNANNGVLWGGDQPYNWTIPNTVPWNACKGSISKYVHPFTVAYPSSEGVTVSSARTKGDFVDGEDQTTHMVTVPYRATRSEATNRVYYAFVVGHGDLTDTFRSPIKTFKSFFPVMPNKGLIDGDLINVPVTFNGQPVKTWQYMYKFLSNPDGGSGLNVAIKYAEP